MKNKPMPLARVRVQVICSLLLGSVAFFPATLLGQWTGQPEILQQPSSPTVSSGSSCTLAVRATGHGPLYYQWYHDGIAVSAATNNMLNFTAQSQHNGNYWAVINNWVGVVTSAVATVTVEAETSIALNVDFGKIGATTKTGFAAAGITGADFWNSDPLIGAVSALKLSDGRSTGIRLGLTFPIPATNTIASADPMFANSLDVWNNGIIQVNGLPPGSYHFYLYSSIGAFQIMVGSTDYGTATVWDDAWEGPPFWEKAQQYAAFQNVMVSDPLTPVNIVFKNNFLRPQIAGLQIVQFGLEGRKPAVWMQPTNQLIRTDTNLALVTTITGNPAPDIRWFFNSAPLQDNLRITGSTSNVLSITGAATNDSGSYWVVASNSLGVTTSLVAQVTVVQPPAFLATPTDQTWIVGQPVPGTLAAQVSGSAPLTYQWYRDENRLTDGASYLGTTSNILAVQSVQTSNAGSYVLVVTNLIGSITSAPAVVTVLVPPSITTQPVGSSIPLGLPFTLTAAATGTAPLQYQWELNGAPVPGANTASFSVSSLTPANAGAYRLVVTNQAGAVTSTVAPVTVGTVAVWGNSSGSGSLPPWPPSGVSNFIAAAGGQNYSLGLRSDGTILAWGNAQAAPLTLYPSNDLFGIVAIAAGPTHALALRSNGTVIAWGANTAGQTNVPATLNNVRAIAAGTTHSVALRADGTVVVWGGNPKDLQSEVPVGLLNVRAIDAGGNQTLALRADGVLVAWGSSRAQPVPPGLTGIVGFSATPVTPSSNPSGRSYNLAVLANGSVTSWDNQGLGSLLPAFTNAIAVESAGGTTTGTGVQLVLTANGIVRGWGTTAADSRTNVPPGLTNVIAIAGGTSHVLALVNDGKPLIVSPPVGGSFYTGAEFQLRAKVVGQPAITLQWFRNSLAIAGATNDVFTVSSAGAGDVGNYHLTASNALGTAQLVSVPVNIGDAAPVLLSPLNSQFAYYGSPFTLGASVVGSGPMQLTWRRDGNISAQGTNEIQIPRVLSQHGGAYQLIASNAFGVITSSVCQITVSRLALFGSALSLTNLPAAEVGNLLAVSASASHLLAIRPDHTVAAWGTRTTLATNVPANLQDVIAVSAGTDFSVALKENGTVVAWGSGAQGKTNVPPGLSNVVALSAAVNHTLALRADGTVAAWGANSQGITNVPAGLSNVVAVSAGTYHSLALRKDGTVVGWGLAGTIPAGLKAAAIAAGTDASLALKFDGTVTAWSGGFQLPAAANPPAGLSNVVAIAVARGADQRPAGPLAALQSNGTVTIWGDDAYERFPNPPGLTSAIDISCASGYLVALLNDRSPHVTIQPADQKSMTGSNVTFAAFAVGAPPLQWQWSRNGIGLPGSTGQQLNFASVTRSDRASYSATVSNSLGLASTRAARLDVGGLVQLTPPFVTAGGTLAVTAQDSSGSLLLGSDLAGFESQASTNLVDWQPLAGALSITNGLILLQDTNHLQFPARYYRLLESNW